MTLAELADSYDVNESTISRLLSGALNAKPWNNAFSVGRTGMSARFEDGHSSGDRLQFH
jgi:hypothetical protein